MADQSDVEAALAALVSGFMYPNGTQASSVVGLGCRVYRGWPQRMALEADVASGLAHVAVAGKMAGQRTTTRYPDEWCQNVRRTPTLSAMAAWGAVTFAGNAGPGQLAGVEVAGVGYVHRTVAGDTPTTVAASLAAVLPGATASGAVLTVPGLLPVVRVTADQTGRRETRRQRQGFDVRCWTGAPATRDLVASAIDGALSSVDFVGLPDGTAGRLRFVGSTTSDDARDAGLFRRDLIYSVDYATTLTTTLPSLMFLGTVVEADGEVVRDILS